MDPFLAQILMFGGNFAPRGWAFCDGQLLPISQYSALYSIIGTTYGGDGIHSFGLPDLRGRVAIHPGRGPGLSTYVRGERGGNEETTLNQTNMPTHSHSAQSTATHNLTMKTTNEPESESPVGNVLGPNAQYVYGEPVTPTPTTTMAADAVTGNITVNTTIGHTGGSLPFSNIQPFLCVNYIIALVGVYPSRS